MIVGVNKCNIAALALEQLNKLYWGFDCKGTSSQSSIYENYIQYLGCTKVDLITCYPDNCSNPAIINNCNIVLSAISYSTLANTITFYIDPVNFTGATPPITYQWTYNTADFDLAGVNTTSSTLVLSPKSGKLIADLVTNVSVSVIDSNGCTASKGCVLVAGTMQCANDYVECPNTNNLVVSVNATPFFNINAIGLNSINSTAFTIVSSGSFTVNWGDGTIDSFTAGTRNPVHTYGSPYTGYIKVSAADLSTITTLSIGGNQADVSPTISPIDNGLVLLTSEVHKLTGLITFNLGASIFLDGIASDLPANLDSISVFETNLSGSVLYLPRTLTHVNIQGLNTLSGAASLLPINLDYLLLYGLNTISGPVNTLPSALTILFVNGNNTLSGRPVDLPSGLVQVQLFGLSTLTGDIAGFPSTLNSIVMGGNTNLIGNIANLPSGATVVSIIGANTITGVLSSLPSSAVFVQITGNNSVSGDLSLVPTGIQFINIISSSSTINSYTVSIRTWNSTINSVRIAPGGGGLSTTDTDNLLIELAAQVPTWVGDKKVDILGGSSSRSAASNAAVATLVGRGVTVHTI